MKKFATITIHIIYTAVAVGVLAIALLFVGTKVDMLGYQVKVVKSGSMEPAIHTGSIVVIAPSAVYAVGDVITFGRDTKKDIPVTHRVVEKIKEADSASYRTKGDANEKVDYAITGENMIIGKVSFTVPYLGYIIDFARTPLGFVLLIGIPALFIVLDELATIVWEIRVGIAKRRLSVRKKTKNRSLVQSDSPQQTTLDLKNFRNPLKQHNRHI